MTFDIAKEIEHAREHSVEFHKELVRIAEENERRLTARLTDLVAAAEAALDGASIKAVWTGNNACYFEFNVSKTQLEKLTAAIAAAKEALQ